DEQTAEDERPAFGELAGRPALEEIHDDGPDDRADLGAAAADRDPDDDVESLGGDHFRRIDDARLGHVEGAREPGNDAREGEDEELEGRRRVSGEADAVLAVADRLL